MYCHKRDRLPFVRICTCAAGDCDVLIKIKQRRNKKAVVKDFFPNKKYNPTTLQYYVESGNLIYCEKCTIMNKFVNM